MTKDELLLKILATESFEAAVQEIITYVKGIKRTLDSNFSEVSGKVTTLIGSDAAKSVRTIANEELAAQLIPASAQESLDTLQEVAAWIQQHPNDAAAMNAAIANLQNLIGTLPSGSTATTVVGFITAEVAASRQAIANEKTRAEGAEQTLDGKIAANTQAIAAEKTRAEGAEQTLQGNIDTEAQARQQTVSALAEQITQTLTDYYRKTETMSATEIQTLVSETITAYYTKLQVDALIENFITASVSDLVNYYKKTETFTKSEVQQLIAAVKQFRYQSVATLPTASADTMNIIYLVPSANPKTENVKDEFITTSQTNEQDVTTYQWEQIGSTAVDLSGYSTTEQMNTAIAQAISTALASYYTKSETMSTAQVNAAIEQAVNAALASYYTKTQTDTAITTALADYYTKSQTGAAITAGIATALANYYTKTEIDAALGNKQDTLTFDTTPQSGSSNPVTSEGVKNAIDAAVGGLENGLESGKIIPATSENLASWAGNTRNANYTQEGVVETTGGDLSIDSSVPATLMSIAAKTDFSATKLVATGFNLLRRATAIGNGWYFMVPALPFGTINTATQPNGVLFTNSQNENLIPTVYFKPLSSGVPTSVTDGTTCAYTDVSTGEKSYRFYNPTEAGYLIVSGIDRATTCAHIGWSKRYDEYIAIDNPNDAGAEVDIAAGIHALHSYDKMLTVGSSADRIECTGDNQVTWYRLVDRVQPTWTTTPVESEGELTGDYIHTATISGMKSGGAAAFEALDIALIVEGTTISFTDQSSTVENDYVKYELATEVTGAASVSSSFKVEDWGLIIIEGAVGSAYINIAYAQGIPDSVRQMLSNIDNKTIPVIAEAMLYLYNENKALRELLTGKNNAVLPYIKAQTIEFENLMSMDVPNILESEVAGAPSAANVPKNWNNDTMGVWDGCPRKVGQQYVDKKSKKVYYAVSVTGSTADWVLLN